MVHSGINRNRDDQVLIHRLSTAVNQGSVSVVITDLTGKIDYVNRRFTEVTGWTAEEAIGQSSSLWQSGLTPAPVYQAMWQAIKSGQVWQGEIQNRRKDGELYWDWVTISPLRDDAGTITNFLATQENITARRRALQALEESEQRFRAIIEASFDGIYVAEGGILQEVNRGLVEMFGYDSEEEVVGRSLTEFVAEESLEVVRQRMTSGMEGAYEVVGKRKDGEKVHLEITARNLVKDGRQARICAVRNLTQQRLLETQFRQAQKMEAVGRLAGGVAHDFNNLLTIITGNADLILGELGPADPRRDDLDQIRQAALAAAGLTRQLLAFSRQQVIEPRLVAIEEVVENTQKMLKRLIGADINLATQLSQQQSIVKIDPGQLEQVIMNLAVNARDAMPTGGKLTIETSAVELDDNFVRSHWPATPGRYAMLTISDTGVGMDPETKASIFEPFFSTKEVGKGTGLGLATVYGIVKQNGGFIWVNSEPAQGTTFKIYIPLCNEEADRQVAAEASQPVPRGTETILLVEDSPGVRGTVRSILERAGYTVLEATNGKAALDFASRRHPIHLLLTDIVMPEMGGRVLAERFAARRPETRVLYMSGYTDDAIVRHGTLQPGITYLQKPFTADGLGRKVREVLDRR
jgi:two-component system cell cycle sensor histidine kinase/response regulator CckA